MADTLTRLPMGTAIPEWLLTIEPRTDAPPGASRRGNFRFAVDVDVIELDDRYVVLPIVNGAFGQLIDATGTEWCRILASSKRVFLIHAMAEITPEGAGTPTPMIPGINDGAASAWDGGAYADHLRRRLPTDEEYQKAWRDSQGVAHFKIVDPRGPWWKRAWRALFS